VEPRAILLPGVVMPADLAYGALLEALGEEGHAIAKELELYAGREPPPDYSLEHEIDGVLRTADELASTAFTWLAIQPVARRVWPSRPATPSGF
jgi:hypothetical protein